MFDIGFFELLVIGVVGLVVIGPERLPETARAVGLWIGRLKRSLRETRSELEKQLGADDIRRQLHNEEVMRSLEATRRQIEDAVQEGVIEDRPKPLANAKKPLPKKGDYKEEEELPDHAHGDEAPHSVTEPQPDTLRGTRSDNDPRTEADPKRVEPSTDMKSGTSEGEASTHSAKRPPEA